MNSNAGPILFFSLCCLWPLITFGLGWWLSHRHRKYGWGGLIPTPRKDDLNGRRIL